MRTVTRALVTVALCTAVEVCVQAHNYLNSRWDFTDIMSMEVYVNGHVVCRGSDGVPFASAETVFCLRNHDGKGYGCAPGYVYCVTDNGDLAYLEYYQDGQSIWRKELKVEKGDDNMYDCGTEKHQGFCNKDETNPPNPFPYLPPPPPKRFKAMLVGDSITHGMEGDFTWRWRLFAWLQDDLGYEVNFVGPSAGTYGPTPTGAALPQLPLFPGESPREVGDTVGGYDNRVPGFFATTHRHAAKWGGQAAQSKDTIRDWVAEHQPEYLLILLGFNDLGWFVSGPEDLVGNMGQLVDNARKAKPDVKILLGNVVHRSFIGGRQDLVKNINRYNQLLRERIGSWFRWESPIAYVDVQANYNCRPESCPDGYDGLHPNTMGEYHIAEAFARTLKADFGFAGPDFKVPPNPEHRDISVPTGAPEATTYAPDSRTSPGPTDIVVIPEGNGIRVSWYPVTGYDVNRYGVIVWDMDTEGAFIEVYAAAASAASHFVGGLKPGHR
ncbi:hypothetical protein VTI74DRAFT_9507 [Chaetomium olivicolor]